MVSGGIISGIIRIQITSASVTETLSAINLAQIVLFDIKQIDEINVAVSLHMTDYNRLKALLNKRHEAAKILRREGLVWSVFALRKRPILLVGCLLLMVLILYLPTRVLFIRVEGNSSVPAREILEQAEAFGVHFGASRRDLRSEQVKNNLLSAIPQLQWAGVNTSGCVAVISVKERADTVLPPSNAGVSSIVAARDGIIRELTVLKGTAVCKVGDAVKAGQLLVSGYTDCGIVIEATSAQAEIYADTQRILTVVTPASCTKREEPTSDKVYYSLQIGKKLIKLCKDSGISDATCVKMKEEYDLVLPGGFQLPVTLIVERVQSWETVAAVDSEDWAASWVPEKAEAYLEDQMVAGRILDRKWISVFRDGVYSQYGEYFCVEMIGKIRGEEIVTNNE